MQVPVSTSVLPTALQIDLEFRWCFHPTSIFATKLCGLATRPCKKDREQLTYGGLSPKQQELLRSSHVIIRACCF